MEHNEAIGFDNPKYEEMLAAEGEEFLKKIHAHVKEKIAAGDVDGSDEQAVAAYVESILAMKYSAQNVDVTYKARESGGLVHSEDDLRDNSRG
jgi:hypothetical protein